MFQSSTQKQIWMLPSLEEIEEKRRAANAAFIDAYRDVEGFEKIKEHFLLPEEEYQMTQLVEEIATKFCRSFRPSMPPAVVWTAFAYFKRVYLSTSVMEHAPKPLMMGCLYLASKIEEFNVSAREFVMNLKSGTVEHNLETIVTLEPIIMTILQYYLTVHGPFRPLEGHLIGIKTRCPQIPDPESLRPDCDSFLRKALRSDVCLLYPPSQISLAALQYAATQKNISLEPYIRGVLLPDYEETAESLEKLLQSIVDLVEQTGQEKQESTSNADLQTRAKKILEILREMGGRRTSSKEEKNEDSD